MTNDDNYTDEPDEEISIAESHLRAYQQGKLARDHRGWWVQPDSPEAVEFADGRTQR